MTRHLATPFIIVLTATQLAGCQAPETGPCRLGYAGDVAISIIDNHLVAPVIINGTKLNMMVDTGANLTGITSGAAASLHVKLRPTTLIASGIGGSRRVSYFMTSSLQFGDLHGTTFPITVVAMRMDGPHGRVDGLFGTDFLSRYDVDLDLPEDKVVLYKTLGACHGAISTLQEPLYEASIVRSSNSLQHGALVEVFLAGHTLRALLDTGAPYSVLFLDAAHEAGLKASDLANDPRFRAAGTGPNKVDAIRHKLTPITIGEVTVQNLPVGVVDQRSVQDVDMILGMDFMSRVHVWFDFSAGKVLMQYPPKPSPKLTVSR